MASVYAKISVDTNEVCDMDQNTNDVNESATLSLRELMIGHKRSHYYRKLITTGSRTPITDGFAPRWCMSAVIGDHYLRQ
jgi:hypothetical protein